jgi:flagellar basal body-associated protein FliL
MSDEQGKKVKEGVKKAGKVIKWVLIGILLIIVAVVAYSCYTCTSVTKAVVDAIRDAKGGEDKTKMASEAIAVTAVDLYNAYESNALRADNTYKGKYVRVTGKVSKVDQDLLTKKPYVKLFSDPSNPYMDYVDVYFKESEMDKVANLENGKTITVVGLCEGKSVVSVKIKDSFFE